jgi:hypothetical protein
MIEGWLTWRPPAARRSRARQVSGRHSFNLDPFMLFMSFMPFMFKALVLMSPRSANPEEAV